MRRMIYTAAGIIGAGAVALVLAAVVNKDDTGPEILLSENAKIVFDEVVEEDDILPFFSAEDAKDGDVSDSLMLESVHLMESGKMARVIMVAMDQSYNATRTIFEIPVERKDVDTTKQEDTSTEPENQPSGENQQDNNQENKNQEENSAQGNEGDDTQGEQTPADFASLVEQEIAQLPEGYPQVRLNTYEITLQKNETFSYYNYIDSIVDSKDSQQYLFGHIHLDNKINKNESGEYTVSYYVIDSDGNHSNTAVLHVTIA